MTFLVFSHGGVQKDIHKRGRIDPGTGKGRVTGKRCNKNVGYAPEWAEKTRNPSSLTSAIYEGGNKNGNREIILKL